MTPLHIRQLFSSVVSLCICCLSASADEKLLIVSSGNKPIGVVDSESNFSKEASDRLDLKGSRGETLNFQIKLPLGCHSLEIDKTKPEGAKVPIRFSFSKMETITTEHPSFPHAYVGEQFDPLLEITPGMQLCSTERKSQWVWGEVAIPENTDPGIYEGTISTELASAPFRVTVWTMTVPKVPTLPAYSAIATYGILIGHYGKWADAQGTLSRQYRQVMEDHRFYSLGDYVKVPEVIEQNGKKILEIYNTPTKDQSFNFVNLENRPKDSFYEVPPIREGYVQIENAVGYLEALEKTVQLINRPGKALMGVWDEPKEKDMPMVVAVGRLLRVFAPSVKTIVTTTYRESLKNYVDIFCPVMDEFDESNKPRPSEYENLQKQGRQVWWYVSCMSHGCDALVDSGTPDMVLDRPSVYIRSISWLSAKYHIDAFLYFALTEAYGAYPGRDPWKSVWDFSGNGDGTLLYPGRPGEHGFLRHGVATSVRMKLWRESSFDAEYIRWMNNLESKPEWWNEEFSELVQTTRKWSKDYNAYAQLREKAGDYLNTLRAN